MCDLFIVPSHGLTIVSFTPVATKTSQSTMPRSFGRTPAKRRLVILIALIACLWPDRANADWTVSAFLGDLWTRASTTSLSLPTDQTMIEIVDLGYRSESFRSPPYYGYRIAWHRGERTAIGLEAEFIHAKVFAETDRVSRIRGTLQGLAIDGPIPVSSVVQRLSMSHGLNFIFANVAVRREIGQMPGGRAATLTIRAGVGPTLPHAESTINGISREQYESGGIGAQVGGGLELPIWRRLHALGEYKFTWTTSRIDVAGGEATIPARSHHLVGGLGVRF